MRRTILPLMAAAVGLAACTTVAPLCDRDNVTFDKWGTSELPLECSPRPMARPYAPPTSEPPVSEPPTHEPPVSEPPTPEPPTDKPKNPNAPKNSGRGNGDEDGDPGRSGPVNQGGDEV